MCSIDIEDINKKHKKNNIDKDIWCNLLNDFKSVYECFDSKKDVPLNRAISIQNIPEGYDPEQNLDKLGIKLHGLSTPKANYVHAVRTGNLIFLAGKGPSNEKGESIKGKLGRDLDIEEGYAASRLVGVRQLSVLKAEGIQTSLVDYCGD